MTVFFVVLMTGLGVGSWQGWPSLFVIVGLVLNTVAMRFKDPQNIRRSILVTSPLVIIYDLIVRSYGGIVYESVVIVSSIIGGLIVLLLSITGGLGHLSSLFVAAYQAVWLIPAFLISKLFVR